MAVLSLAVASVGVTVVVVARIEFARAVTRTRTTTALRAPAAIGAVRVQRAVEGWEWHDQPDPEADA